MAADHLIAAVIPLQSQQLREQPCREQTGVPPDGMGAWLAVFDNHGDVCASISKRPDLRPLAALLDEKGDEIFRDADSIALEIDMDKELVKRVFAYARKYGKAVYAVVSNMSIAVERRDFLQQTS